MQERARQLGGKITFTQERGGKVLVLTFHQRNSGKRHKLPDIAAEVVSEYHSDLYPHSVESRMPMAMAAATA
jgi:hypothetical protein